MKKLFLILGFLICFIQWTSCQSQTRKSSANSMDSSSNISTSTWKEARYNNVSFKYPPNWFYEEEVIQGLPRMSATPNIVKDIKMLRAFEIIELTPNDWTFADFKNNFISTISNRGPSKATLIKKEITKFKKYEAIYAEIIQDPKESSFHTKAYGINAGKHIYLVTILCKSKITNSNPILIK